MDKDQPIIRWRDKMVGNLRAMGIEINARLTRVENDPGYNQDSPQR